MIHYSSNDEELEKDDVQKDMEMVQLATVMKRERERCGGRC